jgi:hypothetical protein
MEGLHDSWQNPPKKKTSLELCGRFAGDGRGFTFKVSWVTALDEPE